MMMTIRAEIYYVITAVFAIVIYSASGFYLYWQQSKKISNESPQLKGLIITIIPQFICMTAAGFLLLEGDALSKSIASPAFAIVVSVIGAGVYWLLTLYLPFSHTPSNREISGDEAIKMQDVLNKFSKINGVTAVCLTGRDGFLIKSVTNSGADDFDIGIIDAEMIGAIASGGFGSSVSMGRQLEIGNLNVSMIEFDKGQIILTPAGEDTFLVIVAKKGSNIGMIRMAIFKHKIRLALAATV